jgi:CPA1 family monovalent cation:H+ antiporter
MSDVTAEYIDKFGNLLTSFKCRIICFNRSRIIIQTNEKKYFCSYHPLLITLITRYISIYIPSIAVRLKEKITQKTILILGGLRGGIYSACLIHRS